MNDTEQQIVKAVALLDNGLFDGRIGIDAQQCPFCRTYNRRTVPEPEFEIVYCFSEHFKDCPVTIARSLLKESMGMVKLFSVYFEEDLAYPRDSTKCNAWPWVEFSEQAVRDRWQERAGGRTLIVKELELE